MREEIFGPVLPMVGYRTLEDAIGYVAGRPRPLSLYLFDHAAARIERVLRATKAGGVTITTCSTTSSRRTFHSAA